MGIILYALVVATVALGGGLWLGAWLRGVDGRIEWRWKE